MEHLNLEMFYIKLKNDPINKRISFKFQGFWTIICCEKTFVHHNQSKNGLINSAWPEIYNSCPQHLPETEFIIIFQHKFLFQSLLWITVWNEIKIFDL